MWLRRKARSDAKGLEGHVGGRLLWSAARNAQEGFALRATLRTSGVSLRDRDGRAQAVPSRRSARGTCFRISFSQRLEHALKIRSSPAVAPSLSAADTMPLTK